MSRTLDDIYAHNAWANRALIEFVSGLDPTALDYVCDGVYGTLSETIQHIVSGEQWYIWLLAREGIGENVDEKVRRPLPELLDIVTRTGARAVELAREDPERTATVDGKPWAASVVLAQLVHHGNEHRAQAKTILGANGVEAPGLSAWGFATGRAMAENAG